MKAIEGKLYSPFIKTTLKPIYKGPDPAGERRFPKFEFENEQKWECTDATVHKIRVTSGFPVKSFRDLIDEVALVTLSNKNFEMFYRGQSTDYRDSQGAFYSDKTPKTMIYPSICRPGRKPDGTYKHSVRKTEIAARYEDLMRMIDLVAKRRVYDHEYYFSLFQHYDILPTPLIDITQSLRVAASFALEKSTTGFLYVFGLPYPNQSISHYTDMGIVLVKLQNVCPVNALRPRYQEGYLVGKYPIRPTKEAGDNLARRLVAKFELNDTTGGFWDKDFQKMPMDILYPKNDPIEAELLRAKAEYFKTIS